MRRVSVQAPRNPKSDRELLEMIAAFIERLRPWVERLERSPLARRLLGG